MFTERQKRDPNTGLKLVLNFGELVRKHTLADETTHTEDGLKRLETDMLTCQADLLTFMDELIRDIKTVVDNRGFSPEIQALIDKQNGR